MTMRNRPRQHVRKLKSGKRIVINRGIKGRSKIRSSANYPRQLHLGTTKNIPDDKLATNKDWAMKPGGFWTSSYTPKDKYKSDWDWWTRQSDFKVEDEGIILKPKRKNMKIFEIDSNEDIDYLLENYPEEREEYKKASFLVPDWDKVRKDFDAVRLTKDASRRVKYNHEDFKKTLWLDPWDAESTVWFDPRRDLKIKGEFENTDVVRRKTYDMPIEELWELRKKGSGLSDMTPKRPDTMMARIKAGMESGRIDPIRVNRSELNKGVIREGKHRLNIAKELGMTSYPVEVIEDEE